MQPNSTPVEAITVRGAEPVFDAVLVAEQDGRIVAALTADGSALADPFRHTQGIVEFMRSDTVARVFGTLPPLGSSRALSAYEPRRRSRRYWRAKPATNAGL